MFYSVAETFDSSLEPCHVIDRISREVEHLPIKKAGYLLKQDKNWSSWKKRWVEIKGNLLTYRMSKESNQIIGVIRLRNAKSVAEKNSLKIIFSIRSPEANDKDDRSNWLLALKNEAMGHMSNRISSDYSHLSAYKRTIFVSCAATIIGIEIVKALLLRKFSVIAEAETTFYDVASYLEDSRKETKVETARIFKNNGGISKDVGELLQKYGAQVITIEKSKYEEQVIKYLKLVDTIIIIPSFDEDMSSKTQKLISAAFRCSNIKHIIHTALHNYQIPDEKNPMQITLLEKESEVKVVESGIDYTLLRIAPLMQQFRAWFMDTGKRMFYLMNKGARVNMVDAWDVGVAISIIVTKPENFVNEIFNLTGMQKLSCEDYVHKLSRTLHVPFNLLEIQGEKAKNRLQRKFKLTNWQSDNLFHLCNAVFHHNRAEILSHDFSEITKKSPTTFEEFAIREKENFIGILSSVAVMGSMKFICPKLFDALHDYQFSPRNIIFSPYDKFADSSMYTLLDPNSLHVHDRKLSGKIDHQNNAGSIQRGNTAKNVFTKCEILILFFPISTHTSTTLLPLDKMNGLLQNIVKCGDLKHIILICDIATSILDASYLKSLKNFIMEESNLKLTEIHINWTYQYISFLIDYQVQCRYAFNVGNTEEDNLNEGPMKMLDADEAANMLAKIISDTYLNSKIEDVTPIEKEARYNLHRICGPEALDLNNISEMISKELNHSISISPVEVFPSLKKSVQREQIQRFIATQRQKRLEVNENTKPDHKPQEEFKCSKNFKQFLKENIFQFTNFVSGKDKDMKEIKICITQKNKTIEELDEIFEKYFNELSRNKEYFLCQRINDFSKIFNMKFSNLKITSIEEDKIMAMNDATIDIKEFLTKTVNTISYQVKVEFKYKENISHIIHNVLLEALFDHIYFTVLRLYNASYQIENAELNAKFLELQNVTPLHLDIKEKYWLGDIHSSEKNYLPAISSFRTGFLNAKTIGKKIQYLVTANRSIIKCVEDYYSLGSTGVDRESIQKMENFGADDSIPLFIYTLIKANLKNLISHLKLLEDFMTESQQMGSGGYVLATLQLGIEYVKRLVFKDLEKNAEQKVFNEKRPLKACEPSGLVINNQNISLEKEKPVNSKIEYSGTKEYHASGDTKQKLPAGNDITMVKSISEQGIAQEQNELDLSVKLLSFLIQLVRTYYQKVANNTRIGFGKTGILEEMLYQISQDIIYKEEVRILSSQLKDVDLHDILAKRGKDFFIAFCLNTFHAMFLHGIISRGSFPLLYITKKEAFLNEPFYQIGKDSFSLQDFISLLAGPDDMKDRSKHEKYIKCYIRESKLHTVINMCFPSSPVLHIYKADKLEEQLRLTTSNYLIEQCRFDEVNKTLTIPQNFKQNWKQFVDQSLGEKKNDSNTTLDGPDVFGTKKRIVEWIYWYLPEDCKLKSTIDTIFDVIETEDQETEHSIHIKYRLFEFAFCPNFS